jgi:quercetin dioxygenase-like cupin family protein
MSQQQEMQIQKGFFTSKEEVFKDMQTTGFWPTTYISPPSPELPIHWHDGDIVGYVMEGSTYLLDADGKHCPLEPGDKLIIPAGALHAEGAVTDQVTYIVTLQNCIPFFDALRMLDPRAYPDPKMLPLDPELMKALAGQA